MLSSHDPVNVPGLCSLWRNCVPQGAGSWPRWRMGPMILAMCQYTKMNKNVWLSGGHNDRMARKASLRSASQHLGVGGRRGRITPTGGSVRVQDHTMVNVIPCDIAIGRQHSATAPPSLPCQTGCISSKSRHSGRLYYWQQ